MLIYIDISTVLWYNIVKITQGYEGMSFNNNQTKIVTIKGDVFRTMDSIKPNGWMWFKVKDRRGREYHVSGIVPSQVIAGMTVSCECEEVQSNYGLNYKICGNMEIDIATKTAIVSYLSSSQFKHIGKKTAEALYDAFGADTMRMIETDFDAVCKAVTLTDKQKETLQDVSKLGPVHTLCKKYPSLSVYARKIVEHFSDKDGICSADRMLTSIRDGIYQFDNILPFHIIDAVVIKDLGVPLDDRMRMTYLISKYMVQVMSKTHNTYISTVEEYEMLAEYLTEKRPMAQSVWDGIAQFNSRGEWLFHMMNSYYHDTGMIRKEKRLNNDVHFYTESMYRAKTVINSNLMANFNNVRVSSFYTANKVKFDAWWKQNYRLLNKEQKKAVEMAVTHPMSFISGGPGRGKSHTAKALLDFWMLHYENVLFLAPTGRAANKLKMDTGYANTGTLARFVRMNINDSMNNRLNGCFRDIMGNYMNAYKSTLVIVDEVSMLDFQEVASLFRIIGACTIVFLGDINQLAPIEPGVFLGEVLKIHQVWSIPITILQQNMRTNVAALVDNADRILDGTLSPKKHFDSSFMFDFTFCGQANGQVVSVDDADKLTCEKAFDYYMDFLKQGHTVSDIMVLCPTTKGHAGTSALNAYFQQNLNPVAQKFTLSVDNDDHEYCVTKGYECKSFVVEKMTVRIMDRLMQTKNDSRREWVRYEDNDPDKDIIERGSGFFNGDVCTVIRYYPDYDRYGDAMLLQTDDGRNFMISATSGYQQELCFGYAITVHKSQGSEANCVITVLPESLSSTFWLTIPFLTKNLLYTAVTRAKQQVRILGSKRSFDACLQAEQYLGNATVAADVVRSLVCSGSLNS